MSEHDWLAERFEENRPHLRAVAYRMLGSSTEADDAVQEAWLRLSRAGTSGVDNLGGWLTTIVARVSLNMLRSRTSRREEPMDPPVTGAPVTEPANGTDPEHEAVLADSVGLALLVVLDTLPPAERLAFVLHDMFAVPFEEIAPIVERSPAAARQLASRARRRVQEARVQEARVHEEGSGDPDTERPGAIWTLRGETRVVFAFTITGGTITAIELIADPEYIARLEVVPLSAGAEARRAQRGQLAGSSGIALARTTLA
jgi:RNA polymerase sigma factor (sigma-70 family)